MSAIAPGMIFLAYLCGSISSAILVCRIAGLPDPRVSGSGNPGATNVLRIGGKGAAVAVVNKSGAVQSVIDVTYAINLKPGDPDEIKLKVANGRNVIKRNNKSAQNMEA